MTSYVFEGLAFKGWSATRKIVVTGKLEQELSYCLPALLQAYACYGHDSTVKQHNAIVRLLNEKIISSAGSSVLLEMVKTLDDYVEHKRWPLFQWQGLGFWKVSV